MDDVSVATIGELSRKLGGEIPTPFRLLLQFGGFRLDLESNSLTVVNELADYFGSFVLKPTSPQPAATTIVRAIEHPSLNVPWPFTVKQPDPGKSKIKEEYLNLDNGRIVRKRLTGMLFLFSRGEHLAIGPCEANLNQIVNFVNNRCIQHFLDEGWLLAHSAAVSQKNGGTNRGLAIAGFSGRGKSTLALHLLEDGATFHSNDRLLVRHATSGLEMVGVAKLPRINPGTIMASSALRGMLTSEAIARYSALTGDQLWELEEKYDGRIDRLYGTERFQLDGPLDAIVVLTWVRNGGSFQWSVASPIRRRELLSAFAKEPGLFYLSPDDSAASTPVDLDSYELELAACPIYEFSGGADFDAARKVCRDILAGAI